MPSLKKESSTSSKSQLNRLKSSFLLQLDFRWNLKAGRRLTRDRVVFCVSAGENQELKRFQDQTRKSRVGGVLQELKMLMHSHTQKSTARRWIEKARRSTSNVDKVQGKEGFGRFTTFSCHYPVTYPRFLSSFKESHSLIWLKTARKAK